MDRASFGISLLILWLSHLVMDFMLGVWTVYKTMASIDLVTAGVMSTVAALLGEGSQLYFGMLSDRGWNQRLLVLGLLLMGVVPFFVYFDHHLVLFFFIFCSYMGSGAFHPAAAGLIMKNKSRYKSVLITFFASGGMLGAAMSQSLFFQVYNYFEGHTWMLVIPVILAAGCCCYFLRCSSSEIPSVQKLDFKWIWKSLRPYRRELGLLYIVAVCLQVVMLSFSFLLPEILRAKGFEDWLCFGGGFFYLIIGAAVASLPMGYCANKWGYKPVLTMIIGSSAIFLSLFLRIESLTLLPVIFLLLLIGSTLGVFVPIVVTGGNYLVPPHATGFISGIYMGGVACAAGIAPMLATTLTAYLTQGQPVLALELISLLLIFAFGLAYFLPATQRQEKMVQNLSD